MNTLDISAPIQEITRLIREDLIARATAALTGGNGAAAPARPKRDIPAEIISTLKANPEGLGVEAISAEIGRDVGATVREMYAERRIRRRGQRRGTRYFAK